MNKKIVLGILVLLMFATANGVSAASTSPATLSENVKLDENKLKTFTIICGTENVADSQIVIVGNTADNETILRQMLTVYPSYFVRLDNSENKTFTTNIRPKDIATGTYSGYFSITGLTTVPIAITVQENENIITGGLTPTKGTIVATMGRSNTLQKSITVYNYTGYALTDFDAEMSDVQLYGSEGTDWFTVTFEAPYSLNNGSSVDVNVEIKPVLVPTGIHERTLEITGFYGQFKYKTTVKFRITVYGEELPSENIETIEVNVNQVEVGTGERIRVNASPTSASIDVYIGTQLKGTTEDGILYFDAPMEAGVYTLNFKSGGDTVSTSQIKVYTKQSLDVALDKEEVEDGGKVTGRVFSNGLPVSGVLVTMGSKSAYTNLSGEFELGTNSVGNVSVTANERKDTSSYIWYTAGSATIEVFQPTPWGLYIAVLVSVVLCLVITYYKREDVMDWIAAIRGRSPL